ncbi:RNA polymerase sigma-70 factor [soil metagenome]
MSESVSEPGSGPVSEPVGDPFTDDRGLLFTVAYEILGTVSDAEDAVQDAWERWKTANTTLVEHPRAYAARIVARVALNRLRSAVRRRETYVGPWLPEPVLTAPDVADDVARADEVSTAMLVVLETLSPAERAVFVLREIFDLPVADVAQVVDRSEPAVRQLAHRARTHVLARRPRYDADRDLHRAVTAAFLSACRRGDLDALVSLLDPDIRLVSDGGGLVSAARRPIDGAGAVARFLLGLARRYEGIDVVSCELNGEPGLVLVADGEPISTLQLGVRDGRIGHIWSMRNPEKLASVSTTRSLVVEALRAGPGVRGPA